MFLHRLAQSKAKHIGLALVLMMAVPATALAGPDRTYEKKFKGNGGKITADWNGRVTWRHDGAYTFDLDGDRTIEELARQPETDE